MGLREKKIAKTPEEIFEGDRYVHFLDYDDGFTGVYLRQNLLNTLNMCSLLNVNYTSIKLKTYMYRVHQLLTE